MMEITKLAGVNNKSYYRASSAAVTFAIGEPNEGEVQIADGSGTLRAVLWTKTRYKQRPANG